MFWKAIEHLNVWERENLPSADTPQSREILVWLLRSKSRPRPLKDLYRSSRYSEPTVRACLKDFVDLGFIVIEASGQDLRTRVARATPKFEAIVEAYQQRLLEAAILCEQAGPSGAVTAVSVVRPGQWSRSALEARLLSRRGPTVLA